MAISERTDEQLDGYAGTAGCSHVVCHIRLSSYFDDTTLLHELTHAWTQSFRNRWLAEGMAEYISDRAAARIDGRPFPMAEAAGDRPPFPLLDWMLTIDFATASDEQITNEYEGYYWSLRFVEQLEATIGPEALKRAMAIVVPLQAGTVGVRRFMDAIDDAGARADDLFIRYVFPPEREQEIRDRRTSRDTLAAIGARSAAEAPELSQDVLGPVRDQVANWEFAPALATLDRLNAGLTAYLQLKPQLAALSARATETGLAYPHPLQNATASWDFAPYVETIDEANAAIDAYIAAEQELSAPRSIWQQIGLLGRNPDAELERAARAFAAADFTGTIEHSGAAEAGLEKGNSRALTNLLLGAALLALVLAAGVLILRWALRAEPSPTGA
jgi:hypothetical protein